MPSLSRTELSTLAEIGALNAIGKVRIVVMRYGKYRGLADKPVHSSSPRIKMKTKFRRYKP